MTHETKSEVVIYIQELIESDLSIPFYNVKRLLELNDISIANIIFQDSKETNLTILNCSNLNEENNSIELTLSEKSWIEYLPSIYKHNEELKNFLYGIQVSMFKQKYIIDHIEDIFIPRKSDFLDWLASWYGVGFSSTVDNDVKRVLIYKLIELYKKRGTLEYLVEMVKILTGVNIEIKERVVPSHFQDNNSFITEEYNLKIIFTVKVMDKFSNADEEILVNNRIENILQREKPAFTEYYIDSDLKAKEFEEVGIDMKSSNDYDDSSFLDEEAELNHHQHEEEEVIEKNKIEDDDFF